MVTKKDIDENGLEYGKDYVYLGGVRYREGDKFKKGERDITVKKIIDQTHFMSDRGECWHTGMFDDYGSNCLHGKNMIPLEIDEKAIDKAQQRLKNGQVFRTKMTTANGESKYGVVRKNDFMIYYDDQKGDYVLREDYEESRHKDLYSVIFAYYGNTAPPDRELYYVLQDWGVSGEEHKEVLIAEDYETVPYEGIDNSLIMTAPMKANSTDTLSFLKKHCAPSQGFLIVKNLQRDYERGEWTGENVWETNDFSEANEIWLDLVDAHKEAEAE